MLETGGLDCCIFDSEGASDFRSSATIYHPIVSDEISDDAESVMD